MSSPFDPSPTKRLTPCLNRDGSAKAYYMVRSHAKLAAKALARAVGQPKRVYRCPAGDDHYHVAGGRQAYG